MSHPLISVCIPVYNGKKYIIETINSILKQNYSNIEILIQDNASTDGTWSLLELMAREKPQLFIARNEKNYGMASNWNLAINRAKGDYIMLLSADDLLEKGFFDKCIAVFQEQNVDAVTTNHFYLKADHISRRKMTVASAIYENCAGLILLKNPFSINFTLFSKSLVNHARINGNFFAKSYYTCDYDLWIRLSMGGAKISYLADDFLGTYRIHDANLSSQTKKMSRQTALVVLSHKKKLKEYCAFAYRVTLTRFVFRILRSVVFHRYLDRRLLRTLLLEVVN